MYVLIDFLGTQMLELLLFDELPAQRHSEREAFQKAVGAFVDQILNSLSYGHLIFKAVLLQFSGQQDIRCISGPSDAMSCCSTSFNKR